MTDINTGFQALNREIRRVFMVHGPPGMGKTYMLGSAVRGTSERMAIMDFKGGMNTIADLVGKKLPDGKPQVIVARNMTRLNQVWANVAKVEKYVAAGAVQWFVIDNVTDMTAMLMREIRKVDYQINNEGNPTLPKKKTLQDYGICQTWMQDIMGWITRIPCNIVFTAWTRRPKSGESEGIPRTESEGISDLIAGDCEHVFYLTKVPEGGSTDDLVVDLDNPPAMRRILITDSKDYMARSRGGHLPSTMEPDFRKIIEILEENGL